MRGDQLSRQWRIIQAIEAKPIASPPDLFRSPNASDGKKSKKNSLRSLRLGERLTIHALRLAGDDFRHGTRDFQDEK